MFLPSSFPARVLPSLPGINALYMLSAKENSAASKFIVEREREEGKAVKMTASL